MKYIASIALSAVAAFAVVRWIGEWITEILRQLDDGIGGI